ncbi:MAG: tRNA (adenosine(37)-N6)-dimethylallyltransferase MiaA [Candidatus Gracilibacteria bacterium]|nr:tRNA (adenosine(37)-N6)-dimethylallyltransferase MiaA [Candidatus Gracilibacteria bacterium]
METITLKQTEDQLKAFLSSSSKPLLAVVGPTASGKTSLAVQLAKEFNGEVINADSRQVYKEIVIGNALTTEEEQEGVPHHLFSCTPLSHPFNVSEYKEKADALIADIQSRGKLPILCGGTFLWTDAVIDNFVIPPGKPSMERRDELEKLDVDTLLEQLAQVDPESADHLRAAKNKRYIIRALEIYEQTGQKKSDIAQKAERQYDVYKIAPQWDREVLYDRINKRTSHQLDSGLVKEVQGIINRHAGGNPDILLELAWPSVTSIGCKEVVPHIKGEVTREQLLEKLQQVNRNYAKRQLTWLRKDEEVKWMKG